MCIYLSVYTRFARAVPRLYVCEGASTRFACVSDPALSLSQLYKYRMFLWGQGSKLYLHNNFFISHRREVGLDSIIYKIEIGVFCTQFDML